VDGCVIESCIAGIVLWLGVESFVCSSLYSSVFFQCSSSSNADSSLIWTHKPQRRYFHTHKQQSFSWNYYSYNSNNCKVKVSPVNNICCNTWILWLILLNFTMSSNCRRLFVILLFKVYSRPTMLLSPTSPCCNLLKSLLWNQSRWSLGQNAYRVSTFPA